MTIKEFFESKENLVIHCDTEEKAVKLLKAFDKEGYKWRNGNKYTEVTEWEHCEKDTCYYNDNTFGYLDVAKDCEHKVLEFEDIEGVELTEPADLSQYTIEELLKEILRRLKEE